MSSSGRLIAGLGNPGAAYQHTRHNVGFMVIDGLAADTMARVARQKFNARYCRCDIASIRVILAKPITFMNLSGSPVLQLAEYYDMEASNIIILHDDVDLDFGNIRIKLGGGHGGHNGVRDIISALRRDDFVRIRIGIGRSRFDASATSTRISSSGKKLVGHVLGRFSAEEMQSLPHLIDSAKKAVTSVLMDGIQKSMNQFNKRNQGVEKK